MFINHLLKGISPGQTRLTNPLPSEMAFWPPMDTLVSGEDTGNEGSHIMRTVTAADAIAAGLTIHERPRPQFSGRQDDIEQPYTAVVTKRLEEAVRAPEAPLDTPLWKIPPQERRSFQSARASAKADSFTSEWDTAHGRVRVADRMKFYTGLCQQCSKSFTVSRPAARKGKWPSVCGDECRKARRQRQAAEGMKNLRQRRKGL